MKNYPYYPIDEVTNLRDLVDFAATKYGDNPLFAWFEGEEVVSRSFNQFKADTNAFGTYLYSLNLTPHNRKKGELPPRIAIIGENSYEWLVAYFAVVNGGNVVVPLDKDLPEESLRNLIEESGACAIVYADSFSSIFQNMRKKPRCLKHFINMKIDLPEAIWSGGNLLSKGYLAYPRCQIEEKATCAILFTSGTTGLAKGVELSHKSLTWNIVVGLKLAKIKGDTVLLLPLHHTYGFGASVISCLLKGKRCFINNSLKHTLRDIKEGQPEFICVVPLYVENFYKNIWANIKKQGKEGLIKQIMKCSNGMLKIGIDIRKLVFAQIIKAFGGKLNLLISGGAPLSKNYIDEFKAFGIQVIEGYGITECSPIVALNRNKAYKPGSVGIPTPTTEVKISDKDPDTGYGEICVRGEIVMNGYYKRPDITADVLQDGWFRTGDIGYIDDDGFLFITGRKKNLIIRANGKNVHPEELEDMVIKYPEVCEVVVKEDGKDILAEIFPEFESEELAELNEKQIEKKIERIIKEVNKELPVYKRINKIALRNEEFAKTTTKKIRRW